MNLFLATSMFAISLPNGGKCGVMPCLPGIDVMGKGFDIVRGTAERMQPIIEFTYAGNTYVNPFDSKLSYACPVGVSATDNTHGEQDVSSSTFYTVSAYSQKMAADARVSFTAGAFSASATASYYKNVLDDASHYGAVVDSSLEVTLYDVTLPPPASLNTTLGFKQYLQSLPANYSKSEYSTFLEFYGTHYIAAATFGGEGQMRVAVNKAYTVNSTSQRIAAEATTHFMWLKAGADASRVTDQSSQAFRAGSEFKTSVSGGDPTDLTNWNAWEKTFYSAPALIRYTLRPVSELVPQGMEAVAKNVDRAVTDYAGCPCVVTDYAGCPFSYKGAACDTKCGSLVYNAKPGTCLKVPGSPNCLDANHSGCFCQAKTGIHEMMGYDQVRSIDPSTSADSYQCINPDTRVCTWVPFINGCPLLTSVRCQFGGEKFCSEDTTVHVATDADFKAFAS